MLKLLVRKYVPADIRMLRGAIISSIRGGSVEGFFWEEGDSSRLEGIASHLSSPDQPERLKLREVMKRFDISTVLDAACGPAAELASYKSEGLKISYVGLDRSDFMLGKARQNNPGIVLVKGDVESIPFADGRFEAVVMKHILEHLPNYRTAVSEGFRVCSKILIIDFFQRLLPGGMRINVASEGFHCNWYPRNEFENYLESLPGFSSWERIQTRGNIGQTADIYVVGKKV